MSLYAFMTCYALLTLYWQTAPKASPMNTSTPRTITALESLDPNHDAGRTRENHLNILQPDAIGL